MSDPFAKSRDNVQAFGNKTEDAFTAAGQGIDAIVHGAPTPPPDDDGINITVHVER